MSPGATFERVYHELKRMLAEGELSPGNPIEPAWIGKQIASSITPIRDALHRLTGERLVEAPNHNGFRVPLPTEAGLRDLYHWNAELLGLAVRRAPATLSIRLPDIPGMDQPDAVTASLFAQLARTTGGTEHAHAIVQLNARLAPYRRVEVDILSGVAEEVASLVQSVAAFERSALIQQLGRYHKRRAQAVGGLLAAVLSG